MVNILVIHNLPSFYASLPSFSGVSESGNSSSGSPGLGSGSGFGLVSSPPWFGLDGLLPDCPLPVPSEAPPVEPPVPPEAPPVEPPVPPEALPVEPPVPPEALPVEPPEPLLELSGIIPWTFTVAGQLAVLPASS